MIKAMIITGDCPRHLFFAEMLRKYFDNGFLIIEQKRRPLNDFLIAKETEYFSSSLQLSDWQGNFKRCGSGKINDSDVVNMIRKISPDIMFVFGCSLLSEKIFSIPPMGCVNIHTGIVQFFRGVDSCFWAIMDEKPQGIGATIHYVDKSIDAGKIIYQARPELSINDDFSDLFLKSCGCGIDFLEKNLSNFLQDNIDARNVDVKGKLYTTKDFSEEKLMEGKNKIKRVLSNYLGGISHG